MLTEEVYGGTRDNIHVDPVAIGLDGGIFSVEAPLMCRSSRRSSSMQVIEAIIFDEAVTFATVKEAYQPAHEDKEPDFFQAFLASTPGHPVLRRTLDAMLDYYTNDASLLRAQFSSGLGTIKMQYAYNLSPPPSDTVVLLQESGRSSRLHNVTKQGGFGCCCNMLVHDAQNKLYFYSRLVGTQNCTNPPTTPSSPTFEPTIETFEPSKKPTPRPVFDYNTGE